MVRNMVAMTIIHFEFSGACLKLCDIFSRVPMILKESYDGAVVALSDRNASEHPPSTGAHLSWRMHLFGRCAQSKRVMEDVRHPCSIANRTNAKSYCGGALNVVQTPCSTISCAPSQNGAGDTGQSNDGHSRGA